MEKRKSITRYEDFYDMLSDDVRMSAYKKAIEAIVKPGDVVLDLGAGTGVLGFWALQAGAGKVYAIEKTDAIELARAVAMQNGLADRMEFFHDNSKNVNLPEKVDVIVSETLGSFGVDENMMDFLIDARDRFLKPGGRIIPEDIQLFVAPVQADNIYQKLDFWRDVGGVDFSVAREVFSKKLMVETVKPENVLCDAIRFAHLDFMQETQRGGEGIMHFTFDRPALVHGFTGWFELSLGEGIVISTAPDQAATHWKQAFFCVTEPVEVVNLDIMELVMRVEAEEEDSDNTIVHYQYRCTQRKDFKPPTTEAVDGEHDEA